jgi:hypothetical protein
VLHGAEDGCDGLDHIWDGIDLMQPQSQPLLWSKAVVSGPADPSWSNVVLLMGFEGANGSTGAPGMNDESPVARGVATVAGGGAMISTAQKKFGSSSLSLNGASSITFPDSNDFNFGAGKFTVECWFNTSTVAGGNYFMICQWDATLTSEGWALWVQGAIPSWNISTTGTDNIFQLNANQSILTGVWHLASVDYDGVKYRFYLDGVMTMSSTTPETIFNSVNKLVIGSENANSNYFFTGYIDEVRVTKGVARYASDSGFTVPTAAFPRHG